MQFFGNREAINNLKSLLHKIPFILLIGQNNIGKRTACIETIKSYYCCNGNYEFFNGCKCKICSMIDAEIHQDVKYFNYTQSTSIDELSLFMNDSYNPVIFDKKFFILDFNAFPSKLAMNSLLKKLEEPLHNTCIIVIVPSEKYLLPTIISRAIKIEFQQLNFNEKVQRIIQEIECSETDAKQIALYVGLSELRSIGNFKEDLVIPINNIISTLKEQGLYSYKDIAKLSELVVKYKFGYKVCIEWLVRMLMQRDLNGKNSPIFESFSNNDKDLFHHFIKVLIENSSITENQKINKQLKLETDFMMIGNN